MENCFSEKERGKVWKDYVEGIMNEEFDLVHNVKGDVVVFVGREEVLWALSENSESPCPFISITRVNCS